MAPFSGSLDNNNVEQYEKKISTKQEYEEISYFGGYLKFKTEVLWPRVAFFAIIHLIAFYGVYIVLENLYLLRLKPVFTAIYMQFLVALGAEGITIGAHRLWTHKSFKARRPLRIILIILQTLAGQNCCHKWVADHRQHHKYSDTDGDPHNANRGFFFCHMGWLMMRRHPEARAKKPAIFMADIEKDPVVMFQKRHYKKMFLIFGMIVPSAIPLYFWHETLWNVAVLSVYRYVTLLNFTWTVNSVAHFYGNKPYDKDIKPTENPLASLLTNGEGWHNYHHVFPWDYKASEYGHHLNLTRDIIEFFERMGWAYDLKEASHDVVMKTMRRKGNGTHALANEISLEHDSPTAEQLTTGW